MFESVQRQATKTVKDRGHDKWLRMLGLFSLKKRRMRGDLIIVSNFLTRRKRGARAEKGGSNRT